MPPGLKILSVVTSRRKASVLPTPTRSASSDRSSDASTRATARKVGSHGEAPITSPARASAGTSTVSARTMVAVASSSLDTGI
jgi:hypothetical protein